MLLGNKCVINYIDFILMSILDFIIFLFLNNIFIEKLIYAFINLHVNIKRGANHHHPKRCQIDHCFPFPKVL